MFESFLAFRVRCLLPAGLPIAYKLILPDTPILLGKPSSVDLNPKP